MGRERKRKRDFKLKRKRKGIPERNGMGMEWKRRRIEEGRKEGRKGEDLGVVFLESISRKMTLEQ